MIDKYEATLRESSVWLNFVYRFEPQLLHKWYSVCRRDCKSKKLVDKSFVYLTATFTAFMLCKIKGLGVVIFNF
jgi:hypothetical protein